jgi:hypothetical protein
MSFFNIDFGLTQGCIIYITIFEMKFEEEENMIYKQFRDKKISALGLGCMRLPQAGTGHGARIDEQKAVELIEHAYHNGINYFDTAYG